VASKSVGRAIHGYRPQCAFRCFNIEKPCVLSRAGLAGERPVGKSGSRPGKVGRPAGRARAGDGPTPGLGCEPRSGTTGLSPIGPRGRNGLSERLGDGLDYAGGSPLVRRFILRDARPRRSPFGPSRSGRRRNRATGMRPDYMGGGEWCRMTSLTGSVLGASTTRPRPPTRAKFFRNSRKCTSPSLSLNRPKSGKRQNW